VDFGALGRAADTLVLYMARQNIGRIAAALIAGGRSPTDPLAFLLDATTPRERVVHTTIGAAAAIAATLPPAATLVIVGPVAGIGAMLAPHRPEAEPSIRSAQG
jgi:uroporphyrin-III C-methyltransferase